MATTGPRPNTAFAQSLGAGTLTKQGFLAVEPTLQLKDHVHIYGAGDAIAWAEQKSVGKVGGHAKVVAANILSAIEGKPVTAIYKGAPELICVTNGKVGARLRPMRWLLIFGYLFRKAVARTLACCGGSRWARGSHAWSRAGRC